MKTKDSVQDEALSALRGKTRAGVAVSMGVGKTLIGLKHIEQHYNDTLRVLVVAPKISIFTSWQDDAVKFNLEYLLPHIEFTTYVSLVKKDFDYDIIYLDECHSLTDNHNYWLSKYQGMIIGLTGTPPRSSVSTKGVLVDKFCPIVYSYIVKNAVNDKILNDYRVIVHELSLDFLKTIKVEKNGKVWFTSEVSQYEYWSRRIQDAGTRKEQQICTIMRMKALQNFPSKVLYGRKLFESISEKCIIFTNSQIQADSMCMYSYHSGNTNSNENLKLFKEGKINKLSCVLQLNEGVNIPNLKHGIIMHAYGNERKSNQRIGRLLRLSPNEVATIHVLCYKNTIDEQWVEQALLDLDENKIEYVHN
jgi:superfamily II DNA or RNA helicase